MSAERDLGARGEPAQLVVTVGSDEVGSLGQIVFASDGLENLVGEKAVEGNDGGRVAGEAASGEGINLVDGGAQT
jgi:hypothetical protein